MDGNYSDLEKEILIPKLELELQQLETRKKAIQALITKIKNSSSDSSKRQFLLKDKNFTWKSISMDILKKRTAFLTTDEIYNEVINLHPDLKESASKRNVQASLSGALSLLADDGDVVRIEKKFTRGNLWGLPDWFDEKGTPKDYFKKQLIMRGVPDFRILITRVKDDF